MENPLKLIIDKMYDENPNAYFCIFAGARLFIWNNEIKKFIAHNNPNTKLEIDDPLLITQLDNGINVCPMMRFENLDSLLEYISEADFEKEYAAHLINIQNEIIQRMNIISQIAPLN